MEEKKKGGSLKKIIIVVVVLVVLAGIGSAMGGKDKPKKVADKKTESTDTKKDAPAKEEKTDFAVGEVAEYKDVQVAVLGYEESTGNDWAKPADGNIFVLANVEISNNSKEEIGVSSMMSFEGYCGDYKLEYSTNALMAMSSDGGKQQMDGNIAAGKKMNGYIGLEVPADWATIDIMYKDNVWLDSKIKFVITK